MDMDTFLLVVTFVTFIGFSQELLAEKCHRYTLLGAIKSCNGDLREARCEDGVIFVDRVKYEDFICSSISCAFLDASCCESSDSLASDDITQLVTQECNHTVSCSLTSITSGTTVVEYRCIEAVTGSSKTSTIVTTPVMPTATSFSNLITSTTRSVTSTTTKANSTTPITDTTSTSTPIHSTITTTGFDVTKSSAGDSGITSPSKSSKVAKQSEEPADNDLPTGVIVTVVVAVVACLASIPAAIILCRRHMNRKQQIQSDGYELDAFPGNAHSQSTSTRDEDRGRSYSTINDAPARNSHKVPETGNVYTTTTEVPDRDKGTNNEYDHLHHRKGKFTGNDALEGSSANKGDNVYDATPHTGTNAAVWISVSNTDNVYDTADHSGKALVDDKSGNTENVYDKTHTADNKQMVVQNDNVYDTTKPSGKTLLPAKAANNDDNIYETTDETTSRYNEDIYDTP